MTKEIEEKEKEYTNYIIEHKSNVFEVFSCFMNVCMKKKYNIGNKVNYGKLMNLIATHDDSKFTDIEFHSYRQNFFPTQKEKNEWKSGFQRAWNHHQKVNPHHWQHWVGENDIIFEMSNEYIIEMLCDWTAMSMKFNNVPSGWFEENRHKMKINLFTLDKIEFWLPFFDEVYQILLERKNGQRD